MTSADAPRGGDHATVALGFYEDEPSVWVLDGSPFRTPDDFEQHIIERVPVALVEALEAARKAYSAAEDAIIEHAGLDRMTMRKWVPCPEWDGHSWTSQMGSGRTYYEQCQRCGWDHEDHTDEMRARAAAANEAAGKGPKNARRPES